MAFMGLRVMVVFQNLKKRNDFVSGRINQLISQSPIYQQLIKDDPSGTDKVSCKQFGSRGGSILYLNAGAETDFTSHRADVLRVDEYQDCNRNYLNLALNRLDGSEYKFIWRLSNAREPGTEDNQNNDWLYHQGDQAEWQVPCPRCGRYQTLDWWSHFIKEEKSKYGAVDSVVLRDVERRDPACKLDPRPICPFCDAAMGRLVRRGVGQWLKKNPAVSATHGSYRIGNLYNPTTFIRPLFSQYVSSLRNPVAYSQFLNNKLGQTNQNEGDGIIEQMLKDSARGERAGVQVYRLPSFLSTVAVN